MPERSQKRKLRSDQSTSRAEEDVASSTNDENTLYWPCIQPSRGAEREPVMDPNGNTRQFAKEDTRVVNNPMTIQQICQRGRGL